MNDMADGLNRLPRIGEPETSSGSTGKAAGGPEAFLAPNIPDTSISGPVSLQRPARWVYDFDPANGVSRATYSGEVVFAGGGGGTAGVDSFNGRTGIVTLTSADLTGAGGASLASPVFSGNPQTPTPTAGDSSGSIASTAFVSQAIANYPSVASFNGRVGAVTLTTSDITSAGGAPLASPYLTGTPQTPTGSQGAGGSQIASQAYVENAIAAETVTSFNGRHGAVTLSLSDVQTAGGAPINAPNFTGIASGSTAAPGTATTQLASTAFVMDAIVGATTGVSSFNTRTGAVALLTADIIGAGGLPSVSGAMTGTPTCPTASAGTSTTQVASTAFVQTAIASEAQGVTSFNGRTGTVALTLADVTSIGGAPLAAPSFSGLVHAPTPTPLDNSTLVATTAFVDAALPPPSTTIPLMNGTAAIGAGAMFARNDHVHPTDTSRAPIASPTFTGNVTIPAGASIAGYLPLTGGTVTSYLNVNGVLATISGSINCSASGAGNANLVLFNNGGTEIGVFYAVPASGTLFMANTVAAGGGSNYSLDSGGNCIAQPSDTPGNFLLQRGAGFQAGGGSWSSLSDARIKDVDSDFTLGLAELKALRPVVYTYRGNDAIEPEGVSMHAQAANDRTQFVGLIVQEVELHFPGMVTHRAGYIDGEPVDDLRVLNTTPLIFALINAVKTLTARVEELEERLAAA